MPDVLAIGEITIVNLNDVDISTTEPLDPVIDQLWLDTSAVPNVLKRWNGTQWVKASPTEAEDVGAETPEGAQEKVDEHNDDLNPHNLPLNISLGAHGIKGTKGVKTMFWLTEDGNVIFAGDLDGATGTFDGIVTAQAFIAGARSATVIVAKEGTVNARRADVVVPESGHIHQPEAFELGLGGASGGSFKLGDGEAQTNPIPYDAGSAAIKIALETVYGAGKVAVNLTGKITWQHYAGLTWNEVNGL